MTRHAAHSDGIINDQNQRHGGRCSKQVVLRRVVSPLSKRLDWSALKPWLVGHTPQLSYRL
jgi:hypothetical protein